MMFEPKSPFHVPPWQMPDFPQIHNRRKEDREPAGKGAHKSGATDPVTAPGILDKAAQHMRDRAATYDKPEGERSMGRAVQAFNAITGHELTEAEGWLLLQVLKDVRLFQRPGYHADSAEDCSAYSALKAEAKAKEVC